MKRKINWDALGISASLACAVHCAILPLVISSLPVFGVNIIHNKGFEIGMIGLALLVGVSALRHSYFHHHKSLLPIILFATGIVTLLAKQVWHQYELWILPFAVLFIVLAHILNWRLCRHRAIKNREAQA